MYFLSYGHLKARVSNYLNIILINKKLENIKTKLKKRIIEVGASRFPETTANALTGRHPHTDVLTS